MACLRWWAGFIDNSREVTHMSQFAPALSFALQFEDPRHAYEAVDDAPPGASAIAGVNSAAWPLEFAAIASVPPSDRVQLVARFYLVHFWTPMRVGGLVDQDLANRVFDEGVNAGAVTGVKLLQEAYNALYAGGAAKLAEDGVIGPKTLEAINGAAPDAILAAYRSARAARYQDIAAAYPDDAVYLPDWLARARA